jgi:predicted nucleic acid-binding Zn ribbon protein
MSADGNESYRACQDCGEPLRGRRDQRFCGDHCRTNFNNAKKLAARIKRPEFLKTIPKILVRNYDILKQLNTSSPTKVKRSKLESLGFNFRYITSCHTTNKHDTYRFCFDQGYLELKDQMVLLVVQPNQVET